MNPNATPEIALCPRCLCPLDIRRCYQVNFCLPLRPPFASSIPTHQVPTHQVPTHQVPTGQHPTADIAIHSSLSSAHQQSNTPTPLSQPSSHSQPTEHEQDHTVHDESRRSSASSSSSFGSAFTQFSINTEFGVELQAAEMMHFSQEPFQTSSLPPPHTSSPSTESSLTLSVTQTPSPSTESSMTLPASDEPPSTARRWVVFRGRTPGVYTSSAEATDQTDGFRRAFMLAFDDPAVADAAYEKFQEDGTIPVHGRGPWVVFVGRQPGVFTSYQELCASVSRFPSNCYRCCENIEEGDQALRKFLAARAAETSPAPTTQTIPGPTRLEPSPTTATSTDDSWWCCFSGAEPGVYNGLDRLIQAAPAPGGVRRVNSEVEGWEMWTTYLTNGEVSVIPPA